MSAAPKRDIIAIGGSAGSGAVLKQLLAGLPSDFPATILIGEHIPSHWPGLLAEVLSAASVLPVAQTVDGQPIEPGRVYIAAPDRHLLVLGGTLRLGLGPRENMVRPAIDALMRSAALSCGSRAVGVILTGMLNDGASGAAAIKARGGTVVVQHPLDAEAEQMPLAALETADVDYVAPRAELGATLAKIVQADAGPAERPLLPRLPRGAVRGT